MAKIEQTEAWALSADKCFPIIDKYPLAVKWGLSRETKRDDVI